MLIPPKLPDVGWSYLLDWFFDLSARRISSGFGAGVLLYSEIESFCRLRDIELTGTELDILLRLDAEYTGWISKQMNKKK